MARPSPDAVIDAEQLIELVGGARDILTLTTGLLRICRAAISELVTADAEPATWRQRDELRRSLVAFFTEVDDEELDDEEREELAALVTKTLAAGATLAPAIVARTAAEAVDEALGDRLLPMFINRTVTLRPGDPIPTPRPDWRHLTALPNSDPWALDGRLDALPHLRLAGEWAREIRVTLDGNWRTWHAIPQLGPGDRLACAVPNQTLGEFEWQRGSVAGRPVFFDFHPVADDAVQARCCLNLLELAAKEGCRVVVFPELSAPKKVVDAMARWLDGQNEVELIVAGSRHRRARDERWHNQSQILFRGWRRRRRHHKFRRFTFFDRDDRGSGRVKRTEHLAVGMPAMTVWLSPCWSATVLVCKDAIQEPMPRLLGELRANLVMVPTLTFKTDAFAASAATVATAGQGITLIANACISASPRSKRPEVVIGMPTQLGSVTRETPPPHSIVVAFVGQSRPTVRTMRSDS